MNRKTLAYYITAHGYGHGARSCDVLRTLHSRWPGIPIHVVSDLPPDFFSGRLDLSEVCLRPGSFDVGMVQLDSIRVDVEATRHRVEALFARRDELLIREGQFFRERNVGVVVADIPALPLEAAARADIPRLAIGNFGWAWIYSAFSGTRWREMAAWFAEGYGRADLLLRLPFSEPMHAFPRIEDIPLVASPGRSRRDEIAALTGAHPGRKWVLLSFAALSWDDQALDRVERLTGYEFLIVEPLSWSRRNVHAIRRAQMPFSDVVASVDAVVSKPGFGIVSDCVVNRKPIVYADRTDFLEYPVLVSAIEKYLRNAHIPSASLYRGELEDALEQLWSLPEKTIVLASGGEHVAAERIVGFFD